MSKKTTRKRWTPGDPATIKVNGKAVDVNEWRKIGPRLVQGMEFDHRLINALLDGLQARGIDRSVLPNTKMRLVHRFREALDRPPMTNSEAEHMGNEQLQALAQAYADKWNLSQTEHGDDLQQADHYKVKHGITPNTLDKARRAARLKKSKKRGGRWYHSQSEVRRLWPDCFE